MMKDVSSIIILPKKDMNSFLKSNNEEKIREMLKSLSQTNVELSLPKFKIEYKTSLKNTLKTNGNGIMLY